MTDDHNCPDNLEQTGDPYGVSSSQPDMVEIPCECAVCGEPATARLFDSDTEVEVEVEVEDDDTPDQVTLGEFGEVTA